MPYSCGVWMNCDQLFLTPYLLPGGESMEDYAVLEDKQSHKMLLLYVQVLDLTRFLQVDIHVEV